MASISINVDAETAKAFAKVSEQEKRRMELLLSLRLRRWMNDPRRSLGEIMNEIGAEAKARGLTEEKLESLLHGE